MAQDGCCGEVVMADQNKKVVYVCAWCGESLHQVEDRYSMAPRAIYIDADRNQFDSKFCRDMFTAGRDDDEV